VEREFLQLSFWDQFTAGEAEAVGRALARCLPAPWAFDGVAFHEMGDQKRQVAFFTWEGARFALIPGGEVALGYDRGRPFVPDAEALAEWRAASAAASDYEWDGFLDKCLTPLRRVTFAPFLLEVEAAAYGQVRVPAGEPVQGLGTALFRAYSEMKGDRHFAVYQRRLLFETLCAELAENGFRPPMSDEWEYACSGGSRALWRCGDQLDPPAALDGKPVWARPNAFGLRIAFDSYESELCGPPPVWRGGDGGVSVCGGEGLLAWQIVLATAYHESAQDEPDGFASPDVRRAFPLPPDCLD
jgi:hypothetical protein